ncbi:MAG: hypothetical protein FJW39_13460 [Acidobacteria bacterium]|nr:hypothetical protein [Acidobacteriota bacterium]
MNLPRPHPDPRLAELERVLSSQEFSGPGRLNRFLRFVVEETVAGRGDQIKEYLIGVEVYDKPESFDPKVDSTVRSEATKLRNRLAAYYEGPGRPAPLIISIPRGAYVPRFEATKVVEMPREAPPAPVLVERPKPSPRRLRFPLIAAAGLLLTGAAAWWMSKPPPQPVLTPIQLTADLALASTPSLSGDGKLVVYASTRSGRGDNDIWIQQVPSTGEPLRLTLAPEDDSDPDISPDGSLVAFRSQRDGGGIYLVPALGGAPRLWVKDGQRPRFSPDGTRIAYSVGNEALVTNAIHGATRVMVGPVTAGEHQRVAADYSAALQPVWLPNGKVLFRGYPGPDPAGVKLDWYVASLDGSPPVPTGLKSQFESQHNCSIYNSFPPGSWDGGGVVFSATCKGVADLWRIPLSASTGRVAGPAVRLTVGGGSAFSPVSDASGNIAYSNAAGQSQIWSLKLDRPGAPERTTHTTAWDQHPSISEDGRTLAFNRTKSGELDVWTRDLNSGKEQPVAAGPGAQTYPVISRDGSAIRWTELIPDPKNEVGYNHVAWEAPLAGGPPKKICENCAEMGPGPGGVGHLDLDGRPVRIVVRHAPGKYTPYLHHPKQDVLMAAVSPGRRWIAFQSRHGDTLHLYTAAFTEPAGQWIHWGEGEMPVWRSDGNALIFASRRDGSLCIWTQPANGGRPVGEAIALAHFHGPARQLGPVSPVFAWMSASRDRLVIPVRERTGNIWLLRRQ